jgi:glycosyltransferase involved in cell wall biosynthesis
VRILFVTYYFPPFRTMGAVRTGQTARHLLDLGHDVRVLAAGRQPSERTLPLEIPAGRVTYTLWLGAGLRPRRADPGVGDADALRELQPHALVGDLREMLKLLRRRVIYVPDDQIGWLPYAIAAAKRLTASEPVDLVYASAMPITSLLVASRVARANGVPWVGELRDLWSGNHYRDLRTWQQRVDASLERRVLTSAAGLITVSQPWADALSVFGRPVTVVSNGYDEYRAGEGAVHDPMRLTIVYTGGLYKGRRDPTPLFRALRSLRDNAAAVDITFYGRQVNLVTELARSAGVEKHVRACGEVPYEESLSVQARADVLLLLLWDRPGEKGVMPGKLFEYMGAGRPILAVGKSDGVAADLIESRVLGLASSDPDRIAGQLERWLEEKRRVGRLAPLPLSSLHEYDRRTQSRRLAEFLEAAAASPSRLVTRWP